MTRSGEPDERRMSRAELLRRGAALAAGAGVLGVVGPPAIAAPKPPLADLARATRGPLLRPGSAAYTAARRVRNARFDGARPLAVLKARGVSDVRAAVGWSVRNGVRFTARSGGHSYAGYSTLNGGLVVDLSALNGIAVSADRRTVQIGAGARLIDVYAALARRGLTIPAGSCPTVGVGGLALGGGVGLASRALGTTSDNVVALTVVTADGRALACDARTNSDLFWASRGGGGGNFGIATGFTLKTHRVSSASYFFASFPWSQADEVILAWQRWAPNAADDLFSICSLFTGSSGPVVTAFGQWMGDQASLRRVAARADLRRDPELAPRGDVLVPRPDPALGRLPGRIAVRVPGAPERPVRRHLELRAQAPDRRPGARAIVAAVERRQAQSSLGSGAILLDSYGGAINRVAARRDGLRAPRRALLPPVPLLLGIGLRGGAEHRLAERCAARGAAVRLPVQLPELHRPGAARLADRVLRHQPRAAAGHQGAARPRRRVPLPPEHPAAVTGLPPSRDAYGAILTDAFEGREAYEIIERDDGVVWAGTPRRLLRPAPAVAGGGAAGRARGARARARHRVRRGAREPAPAGAGAGGGGDRRVAGRRDRGAAPRGARRPGAAAHARRPRARHLRHDPRCCATTSAWPARAGQRRCCGASRAWRARGRLLVTDSVDPRRLEHQEVSADGSAAPRIRVRWRDRATPWFSYLMLPPESMEAAAREGGWRVRRLVVDESPRYAVVLERSPTS